ncbi:MAG TPA: GMC family oxidoreductase N-terminal domain-containing protein [Candidatus Limnocylindrales bacterium]|nr:GMC family oxidoreductase N-terminal domain-containing protein [Candidatus Limnocylindrales bacterium]
MTTAVAPEPATGATPGLATPEPEGWSVGRLATLAALAETIVRGDAPRRARLAAAALDLAADPAQVRQLKLVLTAFESRAANLLLTGRPVRFSELDQPAREAYLLAWATSRIPQRRTAYQGLKRLLAFLAYADPGETGTNPRLTAIGYDVAPEPVTADPTPVRPLDLASLASASAAGSPIVLEADVVVVGSGAGGGVVAADIAHAGRSVVVLEAGSFVPEPEMPTDELTAFDRLYLNHGFNVSWDASVMTLAGAGVGGGTLVNWMTCIAPPASTRHHWAAAHGLHDFDTPQLDADLAALSAEIGVSDSPNIPPKDELILRGCTMLRQEVGTIRRNGIDCGDCGRCGFGCRRGAKQSGIRVHLAEAWCHGARIVPDAPVERVLVEAGHATGVEATVTIDGVRRRLVVRAPQVVLAAGALRTPIVLERSGIDHPATGRNLRLHPVGVIGAFLDEDVTMWRGTMQAARALHHLDLDGDGIGDGPNDAPSGFIVESAPGTPGLIALVFPWEGRDAFEGLMGRIRHVAPLIGIVRERGSGSIRLSRAGRPRIDYTVSPEDRATLGGMLAEAAAIAWEGGSREMVAVGTPPRWFRAQRDGDERAFGSWRASLRTFPFEPNRGTVVSAHQMGSARAGDDAARHAADPAGRLRAADARAGRERVIRGLYVGDASAFPSALGVNPMLTTMAWARHVARTVLAERVSAVG